jgi:ribonuclease VapC
LPNVAAKYSRMADFVVDASAVLALLQTEPGADMVASRIRGSRISAVNYSEVLEKCLAAGFQTHITEKMLQDFGLQCTVFDERHAAITASLRTLTKKVGLSFADRACLALAKITDSTAITADKDWAKVKVGVRLLLIR